MTASWTLVAIPSIFGCCTSVVANVLMMVMGHISLGMSLMVQFGTWAAVAMLMSPFFIASVMKLIAISVRDRTDEEEVIISDGHNRRVAEIVRDTAALNHRIEGSNIHIEGLEQGLFKWTDAAEAKLMELRGVTKTAQTALLEANLMLRMAAHEQSAGTHTDLDEIQRSLEESGGRIRAYLSLDEEVGIELVMK